MKIVEINKTTNSAIVLYNGKDTLIAKIKGFVYKDCKLYCKVKLPEWCCSGKIIIVDVDNDFEIKERVDE